MGALALAAIAVTLAAPTHTPEVNAKWRYTLKATSAGKPVRARVTVQIVDPFGGVHPVEFGARKQNIVNHLFIGTFRDYVEFPPESRGFKLTLRFIVRALGQRRVLTYWVRPQ